MHNLTFTNTKVKVPLTPSSQEWVYSTPLEPHGVTGDILHW